MFHRWEGQKKWQLLPVSTNQGRIRVFNCLDRQKIGIPPHRNPNPIHPLSYLFIQCLLSTYCVPDTVPGAENRGRFRPDCDGGRASPEASVSDPPPPDTCRALSVSFNQASQDSQRKLSATSLPELGETCCQPLARGPRVARGRGRLPGSQLKRLPSEVSEVALGRVPMCGPPMCKPRTTGTPPGEDHGSLERSFLGLGLAGDPPGMLQVARCPGPECASRWGAGTQTAPHIHHH